MRRFKDKDHPKTLHKSENNSSAEAVSETHFAHGLFNTINQTRVRPDCQPSRGKKTPTFSFLLNLVQGCFENSDRNMLLGQTYII